LFDVIQGKKRRATCIDIGKLKMSVEVEKQTDLTIMQKRLSKQQKVLSARLKVEREKAELGSMANPDCADLAHDYSYRARRICMMEQLEEQLDEIRKALQRIEDGTYGQCSNCGNFILPGRLEALPYAKLCINCQRLEIAGR
jgi:RNA polymerase-binding protein DksA